MRVFVAQLGVRQQLHQQAGNQVDRGLELRDFLELHGHAPIVLGGMQADPRHGVFVPYIVRVIRLMLVPDNGQRDVVHVAPSLFQESDHDAGGLPGVHPISIRPPC